MITSTKRELTNAIRLGIRPCGFCLLKRTKRCEVEPPVLHRNIEFGRFAKVPNLKRYYAIPCPSLEIKNNLLKLIDCYFDEQIINDSLSCFSSYSKTDYKKIIIEHIRPCSDCKIEGKELCKVCTNEDIKIDLLQLIDEVFEKWEKR